MTSLTNNRRQFTGTVLSNKMQDTLVVAVERTVVHPKYGKRMKRRTKYHVHDTSKTRQVGDKVLFEECRPISRTKRWRVMETAS